MTYCTIAKRSFDQLLNTRVQFGSLYERLISMVALIIFSGRHYIKYLAHRIQTINCALFNIETISIILDNLTRSFFQQIYGSDCLNYLLPNERPVQTASYYM